MKIPLKMNVESIPTIPEKVNEIRLKTAEIVNNDILPNEDAIWAWRNGSSSEAEIRHARDLREDIKQKVKTAGLWAPHLPPEYGGSGLNFLEHAYMNEVLAYAVGAASLFGVVAPNSGNQQILVKYGTEEQKQKWLIPLIEGKMESGFSMTEPDNPGSDPRSIRRQRGATATSGSSTATSGSPRTASAPTSSSSCAGRKTRRAATATAR